MSKGVRKGPGRPKKRRRALALVTRRVRRLIDLAHDGNIRQASEETGLPYATLRDLYSGRRANPGLNTLEALARHYAVPMGWFSDERQEEPVPISGYLSYLDARPEQLPARIRDDLPPRAYYREITFPFAAWEFIKVVKALDEYLDALPPSPERPIIGDATGDVAMKRLATFLLQPLLAAEALGERLAIVPTIMYKGDEWPEAEDEENWVRKLRVLGRLWEIAIPGMLRESRSVTLAEQPA